VAREEINSGIKGPKTCLKKGNFSVKVFTTKPSIDRLFQSLLKEEKYDHVIVNRLLQ
jgi:hypothetical protein